MVQSNVMHPRVTRWRSVASRGAGASGAVSLPGRLVAIHPATLLGAVWLFALGFWLIAPQSVIDESATGHRTESMRALAYFAACMAAFVLTAVVAGMVLGAGRRPRQEPARTEDRRTGALRRAAAIISLTAIGGGALWFLRASLLVGSPVALLTEYTSAGSGVRLKDEVVNPAELAPFTTMVHLSAGAAALLVYIRQTHGWRTTERLLFLGVVVVTILRATLFAERLAAMAVVSAGVVAYVFCTPRLDAARVLRWTLLAAAAFWLAWATGEFFRSWRDTRAPGESTAFTAGNFLSSWSYSSVRLGAYAYTAIDNGIIIVDQWPTQVFPRETSPPLASAGFPNVGVDPPNLFDSTLDPQFTGTTLFGSFYMDAREFGIVLAALFGLFFGLAWKAAALGSPPGIVLYAATVQVILDSYRMNYLLNSPGLVAIGGAAVVFVMLHFPTPTERLRAAAIARTAGPRTAGLPPLSLAEPGIEAPRGP